MLQITRNPEQPLDPDEVDHLAPDHFTDPDQVRYLILTHEHVFASTMPEVTIAPSVRVGLVGDGDPICELVASISRIEPGRVVTTDLIVTDLEDWAPDATGTGHELAETVLDEIVDLINEALSNALHLVAAGGAS
ncbi:hypothetical protein HCA61_22200 [Rhodococcus sp. HNM0563]|uniref:hypothetical protein n=1 Tax=Rhodococcus sp. HNM0563 TaxID=2716339 RepID=UPI00146D28A1|nr:hypothetical protein [Rhodococcus sp. HNM0563]NLU64953.1 hypothetical protein [Rhodococcus sp. HNM0563]